LLLFARVQVPGLVNVDFADVRAVMTNAKCNTVLLLLSALVQVPGLVNVDFADVRAVMTNAGSSLMGQGRASGQDR
jgi:cell division GTPase FtsZ